MKKGNKSDSGGLEDRLKDAMDSHKAVTLRALDVIPEGQKVLVYVVWALSILAVAGGIFMDRAKSPSLTASMFFIAFAGIIISFIVILKPTSTTTDKVAKILDNRVAPPNWSRVVPRLPKDLPATIPLRIADIRSSFATDLNDLQSKKGLHAIQTPNIRVNVFLPNTDSAEYGEAFILQIPSGMHANMDGFNDLKLKFRPHEGLTGRTFSLGESGAAAYCEGTGFERFNPFPGRPSTGEWASTFILSDEQKTLIQASLRWIISFPLQYEDGVKGSTFGVLNIDGLNDQLDQVTIQYMANAIEQRVKEVARELAQLPRQRIAIRVEDSGA